MYTFIETRLFSELADSLLGEQGLLILQTYLMMRPEAGPVIRGSGGIRKMRWALRRKGKKGGLRVIYYLRPRQEEIWLLTLYEKSAVENLSKQRLNQIREYVDEIRRSEHAERWPGNS